VPIEVRLPQLGESVTEGTITGWLVEEGQRVEADQPLFELSSEKIDTEVPAPAGGVLKEIKVGVDETVDVGTVVAVIAEEGEEPGAAAEAPAEEAAAPPEEEAPPEEAPDEAAEAAEAPAEAAGEPAAAREEREAVAAEAEPPPEERPSPDGDGQLMSPVVRRMVAEHGLDVSSIQPSGRGGRITREDVEAAIEAQRDAKAAPPREERAPAQPAPPREDRAPAQPVAARPRVPEEQKERQRTEDLSRIRQRIAAKMMESLQSSAQLSTVQEADVTGIMRLRARVKDGFAAREGVSLSPFVFMCRAAVIAVRRHPFVNAHADWEAGKVTFRDYVNLGIAVDTDKGLIVPNVKGADDLTLPALARAIQEVADKARGVRKLEMHDIEGGSFTMTNTGSRGVLIDTPILNYPEVAILGTGAIQQRPVVVRDAGAGPAIAIRDMIYLSFTYDHRLIDGADAARFVTDVKEILETHDWETEVGYND
jgi:pyruvate dehydrogenase E2 component (dihydrolipoamide acetyltransferase)